MGIIGIIALTAIFGSLLRYLLPGREFYGAALLPIISVSAGTLVWAGLTWLGVDTESWLIWVASLAVPLVVTLLVALILPKARAKGDEDALARALAGARG